MNVPNILSLLRLAMVPIFPVVFFMPGEHARLWAALVYALASLTDVLDGYIARRFHQITRLGRILDPMADKLMTFTVIVCITVAQIVPVWAVIVFFCKEAAMGIGALSMYHKVDDVIPSNYLGKASTAVFFVVCLALMLFTEQLRPYADWMIRGALALTIAAFLVYLWNYLAVIGKRKNS